MIANIPLDVPNVFPLKDIREITPISTGLIHETYYVKTDTGEFVLQKLHPSLATPEIAHDFSVVTAFLRQKDFPAPKCIRTNDGNVLAKDADGNAWRLQTYVPGTTYDVLEYEALAQEAGRLFGRFHALMRTFDGTLQTKRSAHDTQRIYETFQRVVQDEKGSDLYKRVEHEVNVLDQALPALFLPDDLPRWITHGDPKISNIRFRNKRAVGLIDLDTCNEQSVLGELGDAFRSWCGSAEDDPDNTFHLPLFAAAWDGYGSEAGDMLTDRERTLIPQAIQTITLELATRFLTDYFQDTYFGWDNTRYDSRRAHNLSRARGQMALFHDVQTKETDIREVVRL